MTINKGGHFYSKNLSVPNSLLTFLLCVWGAWGIMSEGGSHTWSSLQMRKYNVYRLSFRLLYWWWGFRNGSRILKTFLSVFFIRFRDKYLYLILKTNKKHLNCCPIRHSFGYLHDILLLKWTVPWWKVSDSCNGHKQMENWVEGWGRTSKSKNQLNSLMDPSMTKSKVIRYYVSLGRIKCALGTNTHERSCQKANCESIINSKSHQAFRPNFGAIGNAQVYWHHKEAISRI